MPQLPPDLEHAPPKWKAAFKALRDYAVATSISKVIVQGKSAAGGMVSAQVDMEQSENGLVIRITFP
jgi:hypothetical protein